MQITYQPGYVAIGTPGLENLHPWDVLRLTMPVGGCDSLYQAPAQSFIDDGFEWQDGVWQKEGRRLWICDCWRRMGPAR